MAGKLSQGEGENPFFPPLTSQQARQQLEQVLQRSPRLSGLERSRWWLAGLATVIPWLSQCSLAGVWYVLKRFDLRYKRGREALHSPDENYTLKLSYIEAAHQLARQHPDDFVLLYQDELTYYRRPTTARAYAKRASKDPRVDQGLTSNKKRRVSGCLNVVSGRFIAQQRHRFNRRNLIHYYRMIEKAYPEAKTIFLAQDNWPVHFHPDILLALQDSRICLLRLPTYAPWTNPVEKVWLRLKQELLHHHDFGEDWQALQTAIEYWLDHCDDDPADLLHYVGLFPY